MRDLLEDVICSYYGKNYNEMSVEEKHNMSIDEMDAYITEHKQIEQELGIELSVLVKAMTKGFYTINVFDEIEKVKLSEWRFNLIKKEVHRVKWNNHLSFADYGKTWALTKEELEKWIKN